MADPWNPEQYHRFAAERARPFYDLEELVRPKEGMRVLDLGCGTGELTRELHLRLRAQETLGIDRSPAMLERARPLGTARLRFELADIASFAPPAPLDLVFSNAALHWLSDHAALLARLRGWLAPKGQLAFQVPASELHPSHQVARRLAQDPEFAPALSGFVGRAPVPSAADYSELLQALGFREQRVRLEIYGHTLSGPEALVDWVRGTLLTDYEERLGERFPRFLERYREALAKELPTGRPYFFAFPRVLAWAILP
ncbi:MAG: methyltransferase domain-containing protein [Deltaproteobacteria bacterium]